MGMGRARQERRTPAARRIAALLQYLVLPRLPPQVVVIMYATTNATDMQAVLPPCQTSVATSPQGILYAWARQSKLAAPEVPLCAHAPESVVTSHLHFVLTKQLNAREQVTMQHKI